MAALYWILSEKSYKWTIPVFYFKSNALWLLTFVLSDFKILNIAYLRGQ